MKQHLVAFGGAAFDASAGLVTVPFIADGLIRASTNVMQLNANWDIVTSYFGGPALSRVRLNSARSRIKGFPNLAPFQALAIGGDNPILCDMRMTPVKLYTGENVTLQATNTGAADTIGFLQLSEPNNMFEPPPPDSRRVRFTASCVCIAFGWSTASNIVFDDDLDAGIYQVYGMSAFQATLLGARLVFQSQVEKPGVVANQTALQRPFPPYLIGMGKLGEFYSLVPPFIEALANAAATITVTGYLVISKVR